MRTDSSKIKLWQDYLFLTQEMSKALDRSDVNLLNELVRQREELQSVLTGVTAQGSEEEKLKETIRLENNRIMYKLQGAMNVMQQQHESATAYERLQGFEGRRFDSEG